MTLKERANALTVELLSRPVLELETYWTTYPTLVERHLREACAEALRGAAADLPRFIERATRGPGTDMSIERRIGNWLRARAEEVMREEE